MAKDQWLRRWKVVGSHGDEYTVALKRDGSYGCSCPRWKFAKAPKDDCKHIIPIKGFTYIPRSEPAPAPWVFKRAEYTFTEIIEPAPGTSLRHAPRSSL